MLWHDSSVTLDRLLTNIAVRVEPFSLCLLSSGWSLRLPGSSDVMFHFVLQGSGTLRGPGDESHHLGRYWLAVVPQDAPHALECGSHVSSVRVINSGPPPNTVPELIAGSPESADLRVACGLVDVEYGDSLSLFRNLREVIVADLSAYPPVRAAFKGILKERDQSSPGGAALATALMSQCLVYLLRHLSREPDPPLSWLTALDDPGLAPALDRIFDDPAAPHTVGSLADAALMSRSAFAERFHGAFACAPMAFLHDVRMRRAAQLLQAGRGLSVDEVARRVGFSSRSHFSQAFKAQFGESPAAYRREPVA